MNRKFSKLGSIVGSDWMRGLFIAVATAPLSVIYQTLKMNKLTFDWQEILAVGLMGGIGYLIKNLSTGSNGRFFTNDPPTYYP